MAKKDQNKPAKKTRKKSTAKPKKVTAKATKAKAPAKKAAAPKKKTPPKKKSAPKMKAAPEKKAAPKSAKAAKSYSIARFADMTYLTEKGVREWLQKGLLKGRQDAKGDWQIDASNLEVPNVKRLVR